MQVDRVIANIVHGTAVYVADQYSIDYRLARPLEPSESGTAALLIGTLQIDVDVATGRLLYPWGMLAHTRWIHTPLPGKPPAQQSGLAVRGQAMQTGVAYGIGDLADWTTCFDQQQGSIQLARGDWPKMSSETDHVEFAEGCVAGLLDGTIVSLRIEAAFEW